MYTQLLSHKMCKKLRKRLVRRENSVFLFQGEKTKIVIQSLSQSVSKSVSQ